MDFFLAIDPVHCTISCNSLCCDTARENDSRNTQFFRMSSFREITEFVSFQFRVNLFGTKLLQKPYHDS